MSAVRWNAPTGAIALTAATARTVLQLIAASNHRATLKELSVSFDGVSNTATPVVVRLLRQTTAGTGGTSLTLTKGNPGDDETIQTTANHSLTAEPTAGDLIETYYIHPQGGRDWQAPFAEPTTIPGGTRLGIEITAPAGVNVRVVAKGEE